MLDSIKRRGGLFDDMIRNRVIPLLDQFISATRRFRIKLVLCRILKTVTQ